MMGNIQKSMDDRIYATEFLEDDPRVVLGPFIKAGTYKEAQNYTKPTLRKRIFNRIKAGGKGGKPGQWSARKAQMLAKAYKKAGGGYK